MLTVLSSTNLSLSWSAMPIVSSSIVIGPSKAPDVLSPLEIA